MPWKIKYKQNPKAVDRNNKDHKLMKWALNE